MIWKFVAVVILFGTSSTSFGSGESCSAIFKNTSQAPSYEALLQLGYKPKIARLVSESAKFGLYAWLRDAQIPDALQLQNMKAVSPVTIYRGVMVNKRTDYEPGGRALNAAGKTLLEMYVSDNRGVAMKYATQIDARSAFGYLETYQIPRGLLKDGRWVGAFRLFKWELEDAGFAKFNDFLIDSKEVKRPSAGP